jgi:predicted ester cyclase
MSDQLKVDIRKIVNELNKGNFDVMDDYYSQDFVSHQPPFPDIRGLKAYKRYHANMRVAIPDLQMTIDELIVDGNIGTMRYTDRGTNTGQSKTFPFPPTGKKVSWSGLIMSRSEKGKMVEVCNFADNLGLLQQLGIIPAMG